MKADLGIRIVGESVSAGHASFMLEYVSAAPGGVDCRHHEQVSRDR
jgi:hypothetical protein